jgi:hypothetical protein
MRVVISGGGGFGCHQAGGFGFSGRGFNTRDRCFLGLPSSRLRGGWGFRLRLLGPGRLTGGGHFIPLGSFRGRLGSFLRSRLWCGCLDNTPLSDNVVPPLAQFHLLGRGPGPLLLQSGRLSCGGGSSATVKRLLCKRGLSFFPLHTAPVVRRVVSPQPQHGLFPLRGAATGEVAASTRDAPGCVTAVSLRMSKALPALALQCAFRCHVRLHR